VPPTGGGAAQWLLGSQTINTATVLTFAQAVEVAEAILAAARPPVGSIAEELTSGRTRDTNARDAR
jgi:hypothetical protein